MKIRPLFLLAMLPTIAAAADQKRFTMPDLKFELPQLAPTTIPNPNPSALSDHTGAWFRGKNPSAEAAKKFSSNMPVCVPRKDIDLKMVRAPHTSTDYKIIVKAPEVESAK